MLGLLFALFGFAFSAVGVVIALFKGDPEPSKYKEFRRTTPIELNEPVYTTPPMGCHICSEKTKEFPIYQEERFDTQDFQGMKNVQYDNEYEDVFAAEAKARVEYRNQIIEGGVKPVDPFHVQQMYKPQKFAPSPQRTMDNRQENMYTQERCECGCDSPSLEDSLRDYSLN